MTEHSEKRWGGLYRVVELTYGDGRKEYGVEAFLNGIGQFNPHGWSEDFHLDAHGDVYHWDEGAASPARFEDKESACALADEFYQNTRLGRTVVEGREDG